MKKIIFTGIALLAVLAVVAGVYFWYTFGKPLYEPAMVRTAKNLRAPLKPPTQTTGPGFWQVEPDIKLKHFAAGDGKNIFSKRRLNQHKVCLFLGSDGANVYFKRKIVSMREKLNQA